MKELLNSLSEMLDKKEVKSIEIKYLKVGESENLEAKIDKENNNDITVNIDTFNTNQSIEKLAKEIATTQSKTRAY